LDEKQFKAIIERLDKLMRITALSSIKELTSTERIIILNQAGFSPKEIAELIGTSQNVVNVRLSQIRRRARDVE
jgi:DNA-directed RNA polymerase specialized sigma24 family protein